MSTQTRQPSSEPAAGTHVQLADILRCALAVLAKDLKCEFRAKHAISAILLFAVTSCVAVSFSMQAYSKNAAISAAMLWIVIYFSAMSGLSRSFVREEETHTASTLRLTARPSSIYIGKLAFNWLLVTALEAIAVPLFMLFFGLSVANWAEFAAVLLLGGLGLSAGSTTAAAMVSRAATKGAVFAVTCFPLLVPVLASAIRGCNAAIDPLPTMNAAGDIRILVSYCGTVITASLMLFRYIWED